MSQLGYCFATIIGRCIKHVTMRVHLIRPESAEREGPYLLACTHLSFLEPFVLSAVVRRPIGWMARIEFYSNRFAAWLLNWVDAFGVRRFGVPVSAIRTSINRLERGACIGICPEGGVANGKNSVIRGGPIKRGVCLISYRTGAPILPCVLLGTEKLNEVGPWIPYKRGRLWIAFGPRLIYPPRDEPDRRRAREIQAAELSREFVALYDEMRQTWGITDSSVP